MNGVTCHRLQPILKEPAVMDVNVLHHHVLQWGLETVVGEIAHCTKSLLFLQQCGTFAFSDLPATTSGYLLLLQILPRSCRP